MTAQQTTIVIRLGRVLSYACYGVAYLWFFGILILQGFTEGWDGFKNYGVWKWWETGVWIWPNMTYFFVGIAVYIPMLLLGRACLYVLAGE